MNENKFWKGVAAVALVIAVIALFTPAGQKVVDEAVGRIGSNFPNGLSVGSGTTITTSGALMVGSSGSQITRVNSGLCYFAPSAATIAGSASQIVTCQGTAAQGAVSANTTLTPLTGVSANDHCSLALSTTTALNLGTTSATIVNNTPLSLDAVSASTTAGYLHAIVRNASTSPYLWAVGQNASGTAEYICTRS